MIFVTARDNRYKLRVVKLSKTIWCWCETLTNITFRTFPYFLLGKPVHLGENVDVYLPFSSQIPAIDHTHLF